MSKLDLHKAQEQLSILKNPFTQDKLEGLNIIANKSFFDNSWSYTGTVKFKNGNTNGEQKFKGNNVGDVLHQMEAFIASLELEL